MQEEIALLQSQLEALEDVEKKVLPPASHHHTPHHHSSTTKHKHTPSRAVSSPAPAAHLETDFWDDDDYDDDDIDVGGVYPATGTRPSSRTKRTPRPSNKYNKQFDTKVTCSVNIFTNATQLTDVDIMDTPSVTPKRRSKYNTKPPLPAPEWKRILPLSKGIPISSRLLQKKQDPLNYCNNLVKVRPRL